MPKLHLNCTEGIHAAPGEMFTCPVCSLRWLALSAGPLAIRWEQING